MAQEPIEFDFFCMQFSSEFLIQVNSQEVFVSVDNEVTLLAFIFIDLAVILDDLNISVNQ